MTAPTPTAEHDLAHPTRLPRLTTDRLIALRAQVVEEVVLAVRRHASDDVVAGLLQLLDLVDRRLQPNATSIEQRQRVANGGPTPRVPRRPVAPDLREVTA